MWPCVDPALGPFLMGKRLLIGSRGRPIQYEYVHLQWYRGVWDRHSTATHLCRLPVPSSSYEQRPARPSGKYGARGASPRRFSRHFTTAYLTIACRLSATGNRAPAKGTPDLPGKDLPNTNSKARLSRTDDACTNHGSGAPASARPVCLLASWRSGGFAKFRSLECQCEDEWSW